MIDAHTHLDLNAENPAEEYITSLKKSNVEAAVLILNSEAESDYFKKNVEQIMKRDVSVHLAFMLDIHNTSSFEENVKWAEARNLSYSVKLHPRLTDITEEDFESIYLYLNNIHYKNIIVDSFLYGSKKGNICFVELSTYLAMCFPEKKIVMAHFGGIKVLETMMRTRELHNIFYDCSFSPEYLYGTSAWIDLRHCIFYSSDRVMFGSDRPGFSITGSILKMKDLLGNQFEKKFDSIFFNNGKRIYFE